MRLFDKVYSTQAYQKHSYLKELNNHSQTLWSIRFELSVIILKSFAERNWSCVFPDHPSINQPLPYKPSLWFPRQTKVIVASACWPLYIPSLRKHFTSTFILKLHLFSHPSFPSKGPCLFWHNRIIISHIYFKVIVISETMVLFILLSSLDLTFIGTETFPLIIQFLWYCMTHCWHTVNFWQVSGRQGEHQ